VVTHEDREDAPTTTVSARATRVDGVNSEFLTVVYDEAADELRLYVSGTYADDTATVADTDAWPGTGTLQVGRTVTTDGGGTDYLAGDIDEVRTYRGVLDDSYLAWLSVGGTDI
jgi:hypothetical protein